MLEGRLGGCTLLSDAGDSRRCPTSDMGEKHKFANQRNGSCRCPWPTVLGSTKFPEARVGDVRWQGWIPQLLVYLRSGFFLVLILTRLIILRWIFYYFSYFYPFEWMMLWGSNRNQSTLLVGNKQLNSTCTTFRPIYVPYPVGRACKVRYSSLLNFAVCLDAS